MLVRLEELYFLLEVEGISRSEEDILNFSGIVLFWFRVVLFLFVTFSIFTNFEVILIVLLVVALITGFPLIFTKFLVLVLLLLVDSDLNVG